MTGASFHENERLARLRLIRSERIGPRTFLELLKVYGSGERAVEALPEIARRSGGRAIRVCSVADAAKEMEACGKLGARMIFYGEEEYPALLAQIPDPPGVLTVRGDTALLAKDGVALVGARNASANGCRMAALLAERFGASGYAVVSGLARGIDTAAHRAALNAGTVAVVAGGVDHVYPPENAKLHAAIAEQGAVVAESPFGAAPRAEHFPRRNRIIAGLAQATVVVEAAARSGSLITARLAAEQGREVGAVPGSPLDPRAEGPNRLLRQGATLVERAEDILDAIRYSRQGVKEPSVPWGSFDAMADDAEEPPAAGAIHDARALLLEKLSAAPVQADELAASCGLPASVAQAALLELELSGQIERLPGASVALVPAV